MCNKEAKSHSHIQPFSFSPQLFYINIIKLLREQHILAVQKWFWMVKRSNIGGEKSLMAGEEQYTHSAVPHWRCTNRKSTCTITLVITPKGNNCNHQCPALRAIIRCLKRFFHIASLLNYSQGTKLHHGKCELLPSSKFFNPVPSISQNLWIWNKFLSYSWVIFIFCFTQNGLQ